jgi:phosphoribosylglycinamide formyltransferase-1
MPSAAASGPSRPALRLVVMISGAGSNLLAIDSACRDGQVNGEVVGVISDRPAAAGLARAAARGIITAAVPIEPGESRDQHDERLLDAVLAFKPDLVLLAGYMRILSSRFVASLEGKLLNIHPSLLPRHKGLHTHRRVLEAGEREHGATVHYVTADLDGGPSVLQARFTVREDDDERTLAARVQACEHVIYPTVVGWVAAGRLTCANGVPTLDGRKLDASVVQDFDV